MGATAATPANLVIGAGDVLVGAVGHTLVDRGSRPTTTPTRSSRRFSRPTTSTACPARCSGTHYKIREEAVLARDGARDQRDHRGLMWPGSQAATVGEDTTYDTDGTARRIPDDDYHDYGLRVPGLNGEAVRFLPMTRSTWLQSSSTARTQA